MPRFVSYAFLALALATAGPNAAAAQMPATLEADPDMPRKDGFDTGRAIFWETRNFDPLRDPEWVSLEKARKDGHVANDTPVLVFEAGGATLVLVTSHMAYHHVAQGNMRGEPWMVTF